MRISSGEAGSVTVNSRPSLLRVTQGGIAQHQGAVRNPPSLIKLYRKLEQVGKEKMQQIRIFSLALLLSACAAAHPVTYSGLIVPQAGTCDAAGPAVLVRRGHYVQFTPREGVLILTGQVAPHGALTASLNTVGADRQPYHLSLDAKLSGPTVAGKYITPRCRYAVDLRRGG